MSRNVNSRFGLNPNISIGRSTFDRSCSVKTSFNVGDVVPFFVDEVLPGDTFNVRTSKVVRLQTPITPFMDNLYLDTYYFYVPNRLVWEHWRELNGENTQSAWIPTTEYEVPQITAPESGWQVGTIADYMGIPTGIGNLSVNAMPFRAYSLIMDEWFRDQNLQDPLNIPVNDTTVVGSNGDNYITDCAKGGKPFVAAKYHDYFTSCLPSPQKGPDVTIGLTGNVPIYGDGNPFVMSRKDSSADGTYAVTLQNSTAMSVGSSLGGSASAYAPVKDELSDFNGTMGLVADMSMLSATTINQLRMAFAVQKLYEKDARGGTRYIEILKTHFGVTSPDARLQRPEYLGGNRVPIQVNQVVQTSETTDKSPQGATTAYSQTADSHQDFTRSFVEHGFLIGLCVARYDHTYQQGLERLWSRKDRFSYYWPVFANIGEQAVLNKEIYAQGTEEDEEVFGYQEAWADYRYKPSRVSGEMRSSYQASLDVWHLGDDYASLPSLSPTWIREDKSNVDRVLAVTSKVSNQLFGDFYIQNRTTRPMPLYSIPGLIDHHKCL